MKHRYFRDHSGRIHRVEVSREEIRERAKFWAVVHLVTVGCFVILCLAAGLP